MCGINQSPLRLKELVFNYSFGKQFLTMCQRGAEQAIVALFGKTYAHKR